MGTGNRYLQNVFLEWGEIEKLDASSTILVNSNRLYWQLSELKRTNRNYNGICILTQNIGRIRDERSMYVPMKVEEVKECFGTCGHRLPGNTFREIPCVNAADMKVKGTSSRSNIRKRKKTDRHKQESQTTPSAKIDLRCRCI